jgi:hypothetical protein
MHRHECNTLNFVLILENQTKDFSYTIFLVKKNKCWKNFKIMRNSLFNYSFYLHPEIGKFQGVTLVGSAGVLQPEVHGRVAVRAKWGDELGLLLVFFLDCDLVVPGVAVEEAEQVTARRGVNHLVYPWQPEGVLGAMLVEVSVDDAHPPLVRVLLADEDGVGEPLRMEDFSDEASCE